MNFIYSIILSIQNLKNNEIQKKSLINGIIWMFLWIVISFMTWKHMTYFTGKLLTFIPFTFIKLSGSYIIFTILWIQIILITIGVIFYIFNKIIEKYLQKTDSRYFILIIGTTVILFYTFIFLYYKHSLLFYISNFIQILPFESLEEVISIFLAILFYYMMFSVSISLTFPFISIDILKSLAIQEYPEIDIQNLKKNKIFFYSLRDLFIFILTSLLCYPLLLIPIINIIIMIFLWTYVIKDTYYYTIKNLFNLDDLTNKEKYILAFFSAILNFIPLINIYAPAFGILLFYHYMLEKKQS